MAAIWANSVWGLLGAGCWCGFGGFRLLSSHRANNHMRYKEIVNNTELKEARNGRVRGGRMVEGPEKGETECVFTAPLRVRETRQTGSSTVHYSNARCKELEESREVESGREKGELSEGGVGTAEERRPWNLPLLSSSPHTTFTVSTLSMSQTPLPPPPPPQWVVALNSPMPRPSKAASSIPDPPGFSSSRGGKQVRPPPLDI
jgi:hypothetical protein